MNCSVGSTMPGRLSCEPVVVFVLHPLGVTTIVQVRIRRSGDDCVKALAHVTARLVSMINVKELHQKEGNEARSVFRIFFSWAAQLRPWAVVSFLGLASNAC